jgi:exonuclease III
MVKILTLNVRGIKGQEKQNHLALYAKRQRVDILLLQETNLPDTADLQTLHQYTLFQNPAIHAISGAAIGIYTQLQPHITLYQVIYLSIYLSDYLNTYGLQLFAVLFFQFLNPTRSP